MTMHTPRDPDVRPGHALDAGAMDLSPDTIRFYVEEGRRLQSQALASALCSLGRGLRRRLTGRPAVPTEERPSAHAKPA